MYINVQRYSLVNVYMTMENHHVQWVNPLFLWSFSIAMLIYQRVNNVDINRILPFRSKKECPNDGGRTIVLIMAQIILDDICGVHRKYGWFVN